MTEPEPIWIAGGLVSLLSAIAVPAWRTFLARQRRATTEADGESSWIRHQALDLQNARKTIEELLKLRATDAELIAELKIGNAVSAERERRMGQRIARLEEIVIELKPEYETWIRSDFGPFPQKR